MNLQLYISSLLDFFHHISLSNEISLKYKTVTTLCKGIIYRIKGFRIF